MIEIELRVRAALARRDDAQKTAIVPAETETEAQVMSQVRIRCARFEGGPKMMHGRERIAVSRQWSPSTRWSNKPSSHGTSLSLRHWRCLPFD